MKQSASHLAFQLLDVVGDHFLSLRKRSVDHERYDHMYDAPLRLCIIRLGRALYRPLATLARTSRLVSELLPQEAIDVLVRLRRGRGAVFEPMTEVDCARLCRGDIEVMESPRVNNEPNL